MVVIDASCLYEVVADGPAAELIGARLVAEQDLAAPHVIDVEVLGVIRRDRGRGLLDDTAARQAVEDLAAWPGQRFPHRMLLDRAWQLRANVRGWDAMYVALAEALGATLLTRDSRLAAVAGPTCPIEVVPV